MRLLTAIVLALSLALVACGEDEEEPEPAAQSTPAADACAKDQLQTVADGKLTVGTDKPAFPPYFEDDDPTNGKGFESAVAYAIARELGFEQSEVEWKVVPFNASYRPGPKDFDFDVNQISITPARAKRVDFSDPYYQAPQAVIAAKGSPAAGATSLADLKDVTIGVQIGTTSLDAVAASIQPSEQPKVFDDSNAVVTAHQAGPGRRRGGRPADRPLPDRGGAARRQHRRPVRRSRRRRVGRPAGEGLAAHGLRERGDRQAEGLG